MTFCLDMLKAINLITLVLVMVTGFALRNLIVIALSLFQLVQAFVFYYITRVQIGLPAFFNDEFSAILSVTLFVTSIIAGMFIVRILKIEENKGQNVFNRILLYTVIFVLPVLLALFVTVNDLIWLYYIVLIVMLCTYYVAVYGEHEQNIKNIGYYLITALAGSTLLLNAIISMYSQNQMLSLNFATQSKGGELIPAGILACLTGVVLSGIFPFDGWLLKLGNRMLPLAILNYGVVSVCGINLIFRVVTMCDGTVLPQMLAFIGGFSFVSASILMNIEEKRGLASVYYAIAHIGLAVLCMSIKTPVAYTAVKLMMLCGIPAMTTLFMSEGILCIDNQQSMKSQQVSLSVSVASLIAILSLVVPPFGVFISRWIMLEMTVTNPIIFMVIICGLLLNVLFVARRAATIRSTICIKTNNRKCISNWNMACLFMFVLSIFISSALVPYVFKQIEEAQISYIDVWQQSHTFLSNGALWIFKQGSLIGGFESLTTLFIMLMGFCLVPVFVISKKDDVIVPMYTCGVSMGECYAHSNETVLNESPEIAVKSQTVRLLDSMPIRPWVSILASAIFIVVLGVAL